MQCKSNGKPICGICQGGVRVVEKRVGERGNTALILLHAFMFRGGFIKWYQKDESYCWLDYQIPSNKVLF